jgi:hypothetical protein
VRRNTPPINQHDAANHAKAMLLFKKYSGYPGHFYKKYCKHIQPQDYDDLRQVILEKFWLACLRWSSERGNTGSQYLYRTCGLTAKNFTCKMQNTYSKRKQCSPHKEEESEIYE